MRKLRDSSEMQEAMTLLSEIIEATRRMDAAEASKRGQRLESTLAAMCTRAGFKSAVVVDSRGLPLADYHPSIPGESIGALTVVLAEALARVSSILGARSLTAASLDIDLTDKLVLRRFTADDETYFLVVIAAQELDERSELELSIDQIGSIISVR